MTDHQLKALSEKAAEIMDRLKQGASFSKTASEFNQSVQTTGPIQRSTDPVKSRLGSNLITSLFALDKIDQTTSFSVDNAVTIVRLAERKIQVPTETAKKDTEEMSSVLDRTFKQDLLEQFRQSLLKKYDVKINEHLLASMYTAKDESGNGAEGEE